MIGYIEFLPLFRTVLVEIPVFTFFRFWFGFLNRKTTIFKNLRWSAAVPNAYKNQKPVYQIGS